MYVTFLPSGLRVEARPGDTILDAALEHGFDLPHECGGNCACTTCHVLVQSGAEHLSPMEEVEFDRVRTAEHATPDSRLGCQAILKGGDVVVFVPEVW
jgi:2Fe-2S ferredoxin